MLTLHVPRAVLSAADGEPAEGHAVLVDGDRIAALGPAAELAAAHPRARVRRWPGLLMPGRHEPDAAALLEAAYHPDPREADELGSEPLTGAALAALPMDDTRRAGSARRGVQRLLREGVTSVSGPFTHPAVRIAVERSGLVVRPSGRVPAPAAGGRADFAVLDDFGACLATVLAGRLVHRRR
ncbi:hypothetical protein GCM10009716_27050 [Streptomyces sodiiphilus]|uniref:Aminodeoxyfutalosine deaminase/Imidazolonepropionase-like composite domain-containing protein n=1 Tax=Streptomyces sodiiphilus TaxID=226217 RepID=A0ABN2PAV0_9ACTN